MRISFNSKYRLREKGIEIAFLAILGIVGFVLAIKLAPQLVTAAYAVGERAIVADYLSAAILAVALGLALVISPLVAEDKPRLLLLWAIKAALTLFFLPVYEAHYTGGQAGLLGLDARMYFDIGANGFAQLPALIFGSGTNVTIWLVHWVTRVLPPYFHLLEMLWSFTGLLAIYSFYRGWRWLVPALDSRFLLWIGIFPSIVFWSSILGKDPPVLLGIGLYFYAIAKWSATRRLNLIAVAALGAVIASAIRPWWAVIFAAPLIAYPLTSRKLYGWQKMLLLGGVAVGVFYAANLLFTAFTIENTQDLIQTSNTISHSWQYGGSGTQTAQFHSGLGMLAFLPLGMFTALFRPLPGEVGNLFGLVNGVVNATLLLLTLLAIRRTPLRALREPWVLWTVLFVVVWTVMYAFPSSQNLGTASRFALQVLPVFWPFIFLFSRPPHARIVPGRTPAMHGSPI